MRVAIVLYCPISSHQWVISRSPSDRRMADGWPNLRKEKISAILLFFTKGELGSQTTASSSTRHDLSEKSTT